jgi:hypothetical protein
MGISKMCFTMEQIPDSFHGNCQNGYYHGAKTPISTMENVKMEFSMELFPDYYHGNCQNGVFHGTIP